MKDKSPHKEVYAANKETYDKIAPQYAVDHWYTHFWDAPLDIFSARLQKGSLILDVGCGHGRDVKLLIDRGFTAMGIDYSESMLREARTAVPNGDFRQMDMLNLKFDDSSFSGIWAAASLHHLTKEDASNVIKEFNRILKPDGIAFIAVRSGTGTESIEYTGGAKRTFFYYEMDELKEMLEKSGFGIVEAKMRGNAVIPSDVGVYWIWIIARKT